MVVTPSLIWLAAACGLLLLTLLGLDSDGLLLITGISSLLLAMLTAMLPLPPLLQALLFAALATAGYLGLRRWSARRGADRIPPPPAAESAEVIAPFDGGGEGRVRWQGQSWAALNLAPDRTLLPGARVTVMGREGNRLQVLPR
jgi:membrane protein implicated in regulation of membrane protease activity